MCIRDRAIPELNRLVQEDEPFLLFLRHMDPHAPYLPPEPFERMFYHGDECDPANDSMEPVMAFKPFCDFFKSWMPPEITDKDYVIAQYDGAIAYMDAAIQTIFTALEAHGILDDTIVVINSDHGETLYDHDCFFDHHGIYDVTLHVPVSYTHLFTLRDVIPTHSLWIAGNGEKYIPPASGDCAAVSSIRCSEANAC